MSAAVISDASGSRRGGYDNVIFFLLYKKLSTSSHRACGSLYTTMLTFPSQNKGTYHKCITTRRVAPLARVLVEAVERLHIIGAFEGCRVGDGALAHAAAHLGD